MQSLNSSSAKRAWIPVAAVLMGTGWGSNQFTPMLLVYSRSMGLSTGTLEALFGAYAVGLIPGLLIAGPLSDANGRRPIVLPAAALSLVASVTLVAGAHTVALLFLGRLLAGVSAGAVFGAGTAWLRELSLPPVGDAAPATAARRAAVAMTVGFAFGPLISGLVAQWAPDPRLTAYLPHIVLMVAVLAAAGAAPETVAATPGRRLRLSVPGVRHPRFRRHVGPMAPWVFAAPAVAFALMPTVVGADHAADGVALTAVITAMVALAGVLIQPLARRLEAVAHGANAGTVGLFVASAGLLLSAGAAQAREIWLLVPCGLVLGAAYGLILVAGLLEVQRLAEDGGLAGLTAAFYVLTYLGFSAPYLLALASHVAGYPLLLGIVALLAAGSAVLAHRGARADASESAKPKPAMSTRSAATSSFVRSG
ncbi:MAG: MFS transporter [Solirubrobacteraceae bacterium]